MLSNAIVLLSMVAVFFPMVFFSFASMPLLVLKHDTPQDGRFVRGLFHHYYTVSLITASAGALGHAYLGRWAVAAALAGLAAFVFMVRSRFIPRMDFLRAQIAAGDATAIRQFRRLHLTGIFLNLVQVATVAYGMAKLVSL